MTKLYLALLF